MENDMTITYLVILGVLNHWPAGRMQSPDVYCANSLCFSAISCRSVHDIRKHALFMPSAAAGNYGCQQLFILMKNVK